VAFFPSSTRTRRARATGKRRWLGCSPAVTGSGGEDAGRMRGSSSATSSRYSSGESSATPGTCGGLRGRRGRRARLRARERGKRCLGRCWGWCGSFQGRRAPFYRREREHRRGPEAASTPCVSAVGGARLGSGVGGGLLRAVGASWRDGRG
jgi:hypothetical protein